VDRNEEREVRAIPIDTYDDQPSSSRIQFDPPKVQYEDIGMGEIRMLSHDYCIKNGKLVPGANTQVYDQDI
jgi:hypothetical protein